MSKELEAANIRISCLEELLGEIVDHYVANRGSEYEFIKCITPEHASRLGPLARLKDPTWSLFDRARLLLGEE
jgi:hypothetical protein